MSVELLTFSEEVCSSTLKSIPNLLLTLERLLRILLMLVSAMMRSIVIR